MVRLTTPTLLGTFFALAPLATWEGLVMLIRTTLEEARGHNRKIITMGQRRNEMQPIAPQLVCNTQREEMLYLIEIAFFKLANGLLAEATTAIRDALAIELRRRFVHVTGKHRSTIFEAERLMLKLRCGCHITRQEFHMFGRINRREEMRRGEIEDTAEVLLTFSGLAEGGALCR